MVERCVRCDVDGEKVRLFDAIYLGRIEKICERCSIIENIPIIKRPDALKLKESERGKVYEGNYGEIFLRVWSIRNDVVKVKIRYHQDVPEEDIDELKKILNEAGLVKKIQEKK